MNLSPHQNNPENEELVMRIKMTENPDTPEEILALLHTDRIYIGEGVVGPKDRFYDFIRWGIWDVIDDILPPFSLALALLSFALSILAHTCS
jgi:hypothetical protein